MEAEALVLSSPNANTITENVKKCNGFYFRNQEYLQLFSLYGIYDDLNIKIVCQNESTWTVHSNNCTNNYEIRNSKKKSQNVLIIALTL